MPPLQPANVEPPDGEAVRTTVTLGAYIHVHADPQLMPPLSLVTVPVPVPPLETVTVLPSIGLKLMFAVLVRPPDSSVTSTPWPFVPQLLTVPVPTHTQAPAGLSGFPTTLTVRDAPTTPNLPVHVVVVPPGS